MQEKLATFSLTLYLKTQARVAKAASCFVGLSRVNIVVLAKAWGRVHDSRTGPRILLTKLLRFPVRIMDDAQKPALAVTREQPRECCAP